METLVSTVRRAFRALRADALLSLTALLTLALGIGANTAIFSVLHATLLAPLRYDAPDRLVRLLPDHTRMGESDMTFALADLADLEARSTTLSEVVAYDGWLTTLDAPGGAERIDGAIVSANYFRALGVRPWLGRFFLPEDAGEVAEPVVVLGYGLWLERFGADSSLVGRAVRLNGREYVVAGIAPPGLHDPQLARGGGRTAELWRAPPRAWQEGERASRGNRSVTALARLAPGVPVEQAGAEVAGIFAQLAAAYPETNADWSARLVPLRAHIAAPVRTPLLILFAAALLVLLMACANVAHLLLARAVRQSREVALRTALGASRGRIIGQSLTESLLLAAGGAALGIAAAWLVLDLVTGLGMEQLPRVAETRIDGITVLFAVLLSLFTVALFGVIPALRAARVSPQLALHDGQAAGSRRQKRFRSVLVATEAALAVTLLVGAGLLLRSLSNLYAVDPGLEPAGMLTGRIEISWNMYDTDAAVSDVSGRLLERVAAIPGVDAAGYVSVLPFSGGYWRTPFTPEAARTRDDDRPPNAEMRTASAGYFEAARVRLRDGRNFDERDVAGATPVVLVNRALADAVWPGASPVGQRIELLDELRTVIGVVDNVREFGLERPAEPVLYLPQFQAPSWLTRYSYLVVRGPGDARTLAPAVLRAIRSVDAGIPFSEVRTMERVIDETTAPQRFRTVLLALLAALAVMLAALGVHGVVSYSLSQRGREVAVHLALGAPAHEVMTRLLRQELRPVLAGVAIGVVAALGAGRLLAGLLFGVAPTDPGTLLVVPLLLMAVALAATLLPARHILRTDPAALLRSQG